MSTTWSRGMASICFAGQVVGAAGAVDLDQGALGRHLEGLGHDGLDLELEIEVDDLARAQRDRLASRPRRRCRRP